ncbi:MAG: EscU/YscU/HrcU family type III secretion system export apparatus switch protein [Deltaproteobacteria bacterium]|nr:EscU/YscU/HrcU family type III secretion system export apparatus switch protein [Deltaproteobacteria bacterium]
MARKPTDFQKAVALRYKPQEDRAPKVAAKGSGYLAEKILELARSHHIPIREDKNLVQILSRLDLDQEIPPEVYRAVAEILSFIYQLTKRRPSVK